MDEDDINLVLDTIDRVLKRHGVANPLDNPDNRYALADIKEALVELDIEQVDEEKIKEESYNYGYDYGYDKGYDEGKAEAIKVIQQAIDNI